MINMYNDIIELSKRRGFFWPSFSIYGGFSGFYDYGPLGVLLKENIIKLWREDYLEDGAIFIDTPNLTPEPVFKASGHIDRFSDLACECDKCKTKFKLETVLKYNGINAVPKNLDEANEISSKNNLKCPVCGNIIKRVYDFNLMFRANDMYLRPETAQGIFVNFKLLYNYNKNRLPMIVGQAGKGFRNEISPRQSLIRLKEFNQCEIESFFDPDSLEFGELYDYLPVKLLPNTGDVYKKTVKDAYESGIIPNQAMAYFVLKTQRLLNKIGIKNEMLRFRQHMPDERAHYAADSWDAEALIDDEWFEIVGIANRTNFDLTNHGNNSSESMTVKIGEKEVIPYVIEPSYGIDRIILSVMSQSFYKRDNGYNVLALNEYVAPFHMAVFPLLKKQKLQEKAKELFSNLFPKDKYIIYDDVGSIGKRYARQDEIGTPYCITIDFQTLDDNTVTVRFRDSMQQKRILISDLVSQENPLSALNALKIVQ